MRLRGNGCYSSLQKMPGRIIVTWQSQDKKTLKRINTLIKDIQRDPFAGIGKPEPLKYDFQGAWSRRIDAENRLIYMLDESGVAFSLLKTITKFLKESLFYS